jgi:hypothetical protein
VPVPLAEIVIEEGLLSAEQLAAAATRADESGTPLVTCLVREFGVDEVALVAALKKRVRVGTIDPARVEFDSDALREISRDDCRRLRVVPLSLGIYGSGPRHLRLAMADPTDAVALAEVEHLTGCHVEPCLMTLSAVEEMIETGYKHFVTEVMSRQATVARTPAPGSEQQGKKQQGKKKAVAKPKTAPFHRLQQDATPSVQVEALVQLLVDKKLISAEEYTDTLRSLMKKGRSKVD